jgi:hypothetical protein
MEDEFHVMFECSHYADIKATHFDTPLLAIHSPRNASAVLCTLCPLAALSGSRSAAALGHLPPNRLLRLSAQVGLDAGLDRWLSDSDSTLRQQPARRQRQPAPQHRV